MGSHKTIPRLVKILLVVFATAIAAIYIFHFTQSNIGRRSLRSKLAPFIAASRSNPSHNELIQAQKWLEIDKAKYSDFLTSKEEEAFKTLNRKLDAISFFFETAEESGQCSKITSLAEIYLEACGINPITVSTSPQQALIDRRTAEFLAKKKYFDENRDKTDSFEGLERLREMKLLIAIIKETKVPTTSQANYFNPSLAVAYGFSDLSESAISLAKSLKSIKWL